MEFPPYHGWRLWIVDGVEHKQVSRDVVYRLAFIQKGPDVFRWLIRFLFHLPGELALRPDRAKEGLYSLVCETDH